MAEGIGKGPGSQGPMHMDLKGTFEKSVQHVFKNWTLLSLAVEQGWGGRKSREKGNTLYEEFMQLLEEKARRRVGPLSDEKEDDVNLVADWLYERLLALFHCEADDESPAEVAEVVLRLHRTTRSGDVGFAQEILSHKGLSDLSKCRGVDDTQYASPEEALVAGFDAMVVDEEGAGDEDGSSSDGSSDDDLQDAEPVPKKRIEPEVDEDGFTSVPVRRKGKGKGKGAYGK